MRFKNSENTAWYRIYVSLLLLRRLKAVEVVTNQLVSAVAFYLSAALILRLLRGKVVLPWLFEKIKGHQGNFQNFQRASRQYEKKHKVLQVACTNICSILRASFSLTRTVYLVGFKYWHILIKIRILLLQIYPKLIKGKDLSNSITMFECNNFMHPLKKKKKQKKHESEVCGIAILDNLIPKFMHLKIHMFSSTTISMDLWFEDQFLKTVFAMKSLCSTIGRQRRSMKNNYSVCYLRISIITGAWKVVFCVCISQLVHGWLCVEF